MSSESEISCSSPEPDESTPRPFIVLV